MNLILRYVVGLLFLSKSMVKLRMLSASIRSSRSPDQSNIQHKILISPVTYNKDIRYFFMQNLSMIESSFLQKLDLINSNKALSHFHFIFYS